jgi:hypothetical protein
MVGTPNHGAFLIPQALTGLAQTCRLLCSVDLHHDRAGLLAILDTFPGPYQMMPSPRVVPEAERLYRATSYDGLPVSQRHLDRARAFHDWLADVVDPSRMIHLAGTSQPTVTGVRTDGPAPLDRLDSYLVTRDGDGSVPLALGPLRNPDGSPSAVPTYYFTSEHSALTSCDDVLISIDEALRTGACGAATRPERAAVAAGWRQPGSARADDPEARREWLDRREADLVRARGLIAAMTAGKPTAAEDQAACERELTCLLGGEWHGPRHADRSTLLPAMDSSSGVAS